MKPFKTIASVVPGPAVLFVSEWLELFLHTNVAYPNWVKDADDIALGVGAFVAIVLCIIFKETKPSRLRTLTAIGFGLTLVALAACWGMWFYLGRGRAGDVRWLQDIWEGAFIFAMVAIVATVSVGALSLREEKPKAFWFLLGASILAICGIGAYVWWWR